MPRQCPGMMDDYILLEGDATNNTLNGTAAADLILGHEGNDTINPSDGGDCVHGGPGDDHVEGDKDDDVVLGGEGHDTVFGRLAGDILIGGPGNDSVNGGFGADWMVLDQTEAQNLSTFVDFNSNEGDKVALDAVVFTFASGAHGMARGTTLTLATDIVVMGGFSGGNINQGSAVLAYNGDNNTLWYDADADGAGTAVQIATITIEAGSVTVPDDFVIF